MNWLWIKYLHVGTVILTFVSFFGRGIWMMRGSPLLQARPVKIVPHIIDTLLILSGITLAVWIHQYPFTHGWLTAKLLALIAYIVLGTIALKRGRTPGVRLTAWIAALLVFFYIVRVAYTRNPLPFGFA